MKHFKQITAGLVAITLLLSFVVFGKLQSKTEAAQTLPGTNEVISINTTDGQPINAAFTALGYSKDGNIVLFYSDATNLPNYSGYRGLYTYNISSNTTTKVDISTSGTLPNAGYWSGRQEAKLSETGRYVFFGSQATNLIDGTTKLPNLLYKRDIQTGTTTFVSGNNYGGGYSQNWDRNLGISNDGRFVLLASRYTANS